MKHVRVKICGVTAPADAVGLNFYPESPRCVTTEQAAALVRQLGPFVAPVGVFVNVGWQRMKECASLAGLHMLQTYTNQTPRRRLLPFRHLPAFRVKEAADLDFIRQYVAACSPAAVLLDSFVAGEMGGTGHKAPWHMLAGFDPGVPVILAGGLTPDNVAEAIRVVRPWGVDVASGVESAPGVKDPAKVVAFIDAVRAASS